MRSQIHSEEVMDMAISKEILVQYSDMQEEIKQMRIDIQKTEDSIAKLIEEGTVCDKVTGGLGGIQGFKIEGFPVVEFEKRKRLLRKKVDRLTERENDLLEMTESIEIFIDNIPVSRDRRIFREICFCRKTQQQVANEMHIDLSLIHI